MSNTQSILSITNIFDKEQKRKNRWSLKLINMPYIVDTDPSSFDPKTNDIKIADGNDIYNMQLSLSTASRPSWSIGEVEFHRLNEKYYYPEGKAVFEPMEISFYDTIGINAGRYLYGWSKAVYDPKTGAVGYKKSFVAKGELYMLDPKGIIVEKWILENCWPTTVNFNDLSYEDTGAAMVNVTLRYDRAVGQFKDDPGLTTEQGLASHPYGVPGPDDFTLDPTNSYYS